MNDNDVSKSFGPRQRILPWRREKKRREKIKLKLIFFSVKSIEGT